MKLLRIVLLILLTQNLFAQKLTISQLSCEHLINPIGVDVPQPRLSWKINGPGTNIMQMAYSIRVATDKNFSLKNVVWQSDKVNSGESILQLYNGPTLQPEQRYYWQVKIWDVQKNESPWSETSYWETGLQQSLNWKASWIAPVQDTLRYIPALLVRNDFSVTKKIASARAYITAHGFYELHINGKKVGNEFLTPGWTSYNKRLQYQVYDITDMVKNGKNTVGAFIGDGWYRGPLAWDNNWAIWGKKLGLLCQLKITYTDGTQDLIVTNDKWKSSADGPIVIDGIYKGETYDAQKEIAGWSMPGFDDSKWKPVNVAEYDKSIIVATQTVPVKKVEELHPIKIFKTPKGLLVADFGQNMVGWVKLKVKGKAGNTITIRHAEILDKEGNFYTDNLRAAAATATYILKGGAEETYEPRFSFFGFRYISVDGYPGELNVEDVTGEVVHSDMKPTGTFECSDPMINQLQHNIQWGQKGNFLDVPTDCPQRDERLGWTGDAQAFVRTAAYNMDVSGFFTKWLKDVAADQFKDGRIPFVIPDVLKDGGVSAGWGDVSVIAPWTIYEVFGDKQILQTQYPSMKAYVEYIRKKAGDTYLWIGGSVFGDWLFYKSMQQTENDGYTSPNMIATMFYAYSTSLLAKTAGVLGNTADEKMYNDLFGKIKIAFNKNYVTPEGRIASESQTSYVLALNFNLLPDNMRSKATQYLVDDIKSRNNHLSTGFLGTPYLCHVLSKNGRADVAFDLLLQTSYPSWLYPVKMGATTIWERWDGQKTDGTFEDVGMNSFNHYAYGAIGDWMYRVVAGIEIGEAGYKHILIQPHTDKRMTYAKATFESSYGLIASGWQVKEGKLTISVQIPANTTATIRLPDTQIDKVTEQGKAIAAGFKNVQQSGSDVLVETGSGNYVFEYPK